MKKIVVLTAVLALALTGTAMAADWNFYGSVRFQTFSNSFSKELGAGFGGYGANPLAGAAGYSWTETSWATQGNSRIGANVSAGDVSGRFEYGAGPNLRILIGRWNFGAGELAAGQDYTPTYYGFGNSVYGTDNALAGFGVTGGGRAGMLRLKFGGFQIAAVSPQAAVNGAGGYVNYKNVLPKLEAAYGGKMGPVAYYIAAGYQSVDAVNATDASKSVTATVLTGKVEYGAGPLTVGVSGVWGVNMAEYGWGMGTDNAVRFVGADFKDTTGYGFAIFGGFKINDMLGVEAGYGYEMSALDGSAKGPVYKDDTAMNYYIQLPITLADGVFVVPEIGKIDYDKSFTDTKQGDVTYVGAKWQINF